MKINQRIVSTYSQSLFKNTLQVSTNNTKPLHFNLASLLKKAERDEKKISDVYLVAEELSLIRSYMLSSKMTKDFFTNPIIQDEKKLQIILEYLPGFTVLTQSFLKLLSEKRDLLYLPEICQHYLSLLFKFNNCIQLKIITASVLEEKVGEKLLTSFKNLTNNAEIRLYCSYNPKLLGGFILNYNSISIDASILKEFSTLFSEI